jgi:hypothetical protein
MRRFWLALVVFAVVSTMAIALGGCPVFTRGEGPSHHE